MPEKIQWLIDNHAVVMGYAAEALGALTVFHHAAQRAVVQMKAYAVTTASRSDDAALGFMSTVLFYFGVVLETISEVLPVGAVRVGSKKS